MDTAKLGLSYLRGHISIIPQEPVLFSATLRANLDPFHDFPDTVLWSALEDVSCQYLLLSQHLEQCSEHMVHMFLLPVTVQWLSFYSIINSLKKITDLIFLTEYLECPIIAYQRKYSITLS